MRIEQRSRALESKTTTAAIILFFADGATRRIQGRGDFLLDLLAAACSGNPSPREAAQLELIRQSVDAEEPGGGHMVELIRALFRGPADEIRDRSVDGNSIERIGEDDGQAEQTKTLAPPVRA